MSMRVISGSAGGLRLLSPKRHALRPTQDRIRQVIFSSLAERVAGAKVLDLYAGTGSFGIEALSRGAASADFVEENGEAAQCIRDNLNHCKLTGAVHQTEAVAWLNAARDDRFELIFADPPYIKEAGSGVSDLPWLKIANLLASQGVLVWEHSSERGVENLDGWEVIRHRAYGESALTFLTFHGKK